MASKLVVFFLIVTICKVHSAVKGYQNPASANARCPGTCSTQALAGQQQSCKTKNCQTQSLPCQSPNGYTGLTACPNLQILPGNMKAVQVAQLLESLQKQCQSQNCGCTPNTCNAVVQGTPCCQGTPQVQYKPVQVSSPCLGIQPSLCGPSSACTTATDCILPIVLANALQLLIAKGFLDSAAGCNFNNQDCTQTLPCAQTQQSCYDWATIQNFLNQQNEQASGACADLATLVGGLYQNQPCYQQSACQQSYGDDVTNAVIQALEEYLRCCSSEVCSNACPYTPEFQIPAEIPAQMVCDYGYVSTSLPVLTFTVNPVNNAANGCLVGCQC